jgi:predicted nucleic acid-binding protein
MISRIDTMIISITRRQRGNRMAEVFVDTVAWLALLNASDALNAPAHQIMEQLRAQQARLTTTEFVLLEVADALCMPLVREQTIRFIEGLRRLPVLDIIPASENLVAAGWKLYCQRNDKAWGLTDCISFAVMQERNLTQAFTSDQHFTQAGFVKLLSFP